MRTAYIKFNELDQSKFDSSDVSIWNNYKISFPRDICFITECLSLDKIDKYSIDLYNFKFKECTFSNVKFNKCDLRSCIFDSCFFYSCTFTECNFNESKFTKSFFEEVDITNSTFENCELYDCSTENLWGNGFELGGAYLINTPIPELFKYVKFKLNSEGNV
jgi:uncharacterized protein YjbI with pentapeptide repeats